MMTIDAYRIGYPWWYPIVVFVRLRRAGYTWAGAIGGASDRTWRRRTPDRWRRTWQAEWDGCQHAPRAFTRSGVLRRSHCVVG